MNDIEKAIEFYKAKSYEEGGIRDRYTRLAIEALEKQKKIFELRDLVWGMDISSPTCPEYVEHHRDIQKILKFIDEELLMDK